MSLAAQFREERATNSVFKSWVRSLQHRFESRTDGFSRFESIQKTDFFRVTSFLSPDLDKTSEKQRSSFALIAFGQGNDTRYLLQWNENWGVYNLIGGKMDNSKGDDDCFIRTMCRELEEETGLSTPKDCRIIREIQQVEMRQYSRREKRMKDYQFSVFEVELFPKLALPAAQRQNAMKWLSTGRENILVSSKEIKNLLTHTNKPISPTTRHILQNIEKQN